MPYNSSIYPVGRKQYCSSSSSSSTSMGSSISRAKHSIQSLPSSIRRVLSASIGRQSHFANWVPFKNFDTFYWIKLVIMLKPRSSSGDKRAVFLRLRSWVQISMLCALLIINQKKKNNLSLAVLAFYNVPWSLMPQVQSYGFGGGTYSSPCTKCHRIHPWLDALIIIG